jgi:hypothetical protein
MKKHETDEAKTLRSQIAEAKRQVANHKEWVRVLSELITQKERELIEKFDVR